MISDDRLANQIRALNFAFIYDNLVMLAKLYFIILNRFVKMVILRVPFFDVMYDLQQVDGHRKYLPASLQSLLIFFILDFVLLVELGLSL